MVKGYYIMDKISIIIPVYNAEKYIAATLESVLKQSYKNTEIILVNDGSEDDSLNIILDYKSKYNDKIKVIDIPNGGPGAARNIGIKEATSRYILFVDSDDTIEENMVEAMYKQIIYSNADICICGMKYIYNGKILQLNLKSKEDLDISEYLTSQIMATPCNKLYKKKLFDTIKFHESLAYEDLEIVPKICLTANKLTSVNMALYNYYRREKTRSTISEKSAKDVLIVLNSIIEFYKANDSYNKYYEELEFISVFYSICTKTVGIAKMKNEEKKICILESYYRFLQSNFKEWNKNKYINKLPIKQKIIVNLFKHRLYSLLNFILRLK